MPTPNPDAETTPAQPAPAEVALIPPRHPALATLAVMLGAMLYSIDWTIAVVALPHMQGSFSATQEQIGWVITSYIVTAAIAIPTAGSLAARFGRKRLFALAIILFTGASVACGAADSLAVEVLARIVQGIGGAYLIPLSHAIILDSYPPHRHGVAMAYWGIGAVTGSFMGPTLGGFLTEYLSWRYIFYINVPLGMLALTGTLMFVPETRRDASVRFQWGGFLALALGVGALQMMLDRGQHLDWFESGEVVVEAFLCCLGFYLFVLHTIYARKPFLDPRLLSNRNFVIGLGYSALYGMLTTPPLVLMPSLLADVRGYPIETAGLLLAPRGIGLLVANIIGGHVVTRVDPRALIGIGFVMLTVSNAEMTTWNTEVGVWPIIWTGFLQGIGGGIILVPIQAIAFPSLAPTQRTEGAALFNLVRSVGASVGVSIGITLLVRSMSAGRARLVEYVQPFNDALRSVPPAWRIDSASGLASLERQIEAQAAMLGYTKFFGVLTLITLIGFPMLLLLRREGAVDLDSVEAIE